MSDECIRKCHICDSDEFKPVYTQSYALPGFEHNLNYSIVCCDDCNFIYVQNPLTQAQAEKYYSTISRYSYNDGNIPQGLKDIHKDTYNCLKAFIGTKKDVPEKQVFSVLDIGCSTGHLLSKFKDDGYHDLLGLDASPGCDSIAKSLYGIDVIPALLSNYKADKHFDLVILSGVLEHICDLNDFLCKVNRLLKENAYVLVVVPNVETFASEPVEAFSEFSIEHINFFSTVSMCNLFSRFGMQLEKAAPIKADIYDTTALACIFKNNSPKSEIVKDTEGRKSIELYIENSQKSMMSINAVIESLSLRQEEIVIWGAGSYAARLLASSHTEKLSVKAIVDKNENLRGKKLSGIEIKSPEWLLGKKYPVVIASRVYQNEINTHLKVAMNYQGDVIML